MCAIFFLELTCFKKPQVFKAHLQKETYAIWKYKLWHSFFHAVQILIYIQHI